jgi:ATP-dependent exoDNAse (exonuclease V) beta subunit
MIEFPHLFVLEASAGTGKTHALARRYVQFALSSARDIPHNDLPNILAITFTNKAAREMKERILEWLKKLALGADDELVRQTAGKTGLSPEEVSARAVARLEQIIDQYTDFQVQTIDSFARRVLLSEALRLDLRPNPELTTTYDELVPAALSTVLRGIGRGRNDELTSLAETFLAFLNEVGGSTFVWNPEARLQDVFTGFLAVEGREAGNLHFENRSREMIDCLDTISRVREQMLSLPLEPRRNDNLGELLRRRDFLAVASRKYNTRTLPVKAPTGRNSRRDVYEEAQRQWCGLEYVAADLACHYALSRYFPYGAFYGRFREALQRVKARQGVLHIDDVKKSLSGYVTVDSVPEIYLYLGSRLYHFLIDEFQDTDPIQWRMLLPLLEESLAKGGSVFVVGDLKQAIYLFRRADYRIMRELILQIRGTDTSGSRLLPIVGGNKRVGTLAENRRSGGVLLQFVRELFEVRLRDYLAQCESHEDPTGLTCFEQRVPAGKERIGYVRTVRFETGNGEGEDRDEYPERDILKEIVRDLQRRGFRYRDIAILARRNRELETAVDWLTAEGIPAASSGSLDVRNRRVVSELLELLRFLDSPIDSLALARFLGGEIMARKMAGGDPPGWTHDIRAFLLGAREGLSRGGYLYRLLEDDGTLGRTWNDLLEPLFRQAGYVPLYDLVCQAVRAFEVLANFPEESSSVLKFLEAVNTLESRGQGSIRLLLERDGTDQDGLFSVDLPDYADAIRLLTFHKAKGLGFPIVINLIYESGRPSQRMYYDRVDGDVRVYYLTRDLQGRSEELQRIYREHWLDERIQELNALYVACTRAKLELYNLVSLRKADGLLGALFVSEELGTRSPAGTGREPEPMSPTLAKIPARGPMTAGGPGEVWDHERCLDAKRGDLYHRLLQRLEFMPESAAEAVAWILEGEEADPWVANESEQVRGHLERFLKLPIVREWFMARPGRVVLREQEFVDRTGNQHRVDRVVRDGERITVIDYKTGEPRDYSSQLRTYMGLLGQVYPGSGIEGFVAYVDSGEVDRIA